MSLSAVEEDRVRSAPSYIREALSENRAYAEMMARNWIEEQVWCPHCGKLYDVEPGDGDSNIVSYYGSEDGPVEKECPSCDGPFFVRENVRRTYNVGKTSEEASGW